MTWETITLPDQQAAPRPSPITVRAQSIPARHYFPDHSHDWHQLVYAIAGALTVAIEGQSFVISPEQAVWLPKGLIHKVGSLPGAEFRSLWIANECGSNLPANPTILEVSPLLQALILEAAQLQERGEEEGYKRRVTDLILDQLRRAAPLPGALPWPREKPLTLICEALHTNPADPRSVEEWARELGMSERTLARHFQIETGMSLRSWRRRIRLFKAVELLAGGMNTTQAAMELGYSTTSAFVYAFRTGMGCTPQSYMRGHMNTAHVA